MDLCSVAHKKQLCSSCCSTNTCSVFFQIKTEFYCVFAMLMVSVGCLSIVAPNVHIWLSIFFNYFRGCCKFLTPNLQPFFSLSYYCRFLTTNTTLFDFHFAIQNTWYLNSCLITVVVWLKCNENEIEFFLFYVIIWIKSKNF